MPGQSRVYTGPGLTPAQQGLIYIAASRFRIGQELVGAVNGINQTFLIPSGEKFVHTPPGLSVQVYYNGQRLLIVDDYAVSESGGAGTGFDTITTVVTPKTLDKIYVDYVTP